MKIIATKDIDIDRIIKNPFQARFDRKQFEEKGIREEDIKKFEEDNRKIIEGMAKSFEKSGLLNEIIVREKDGKYQLIAGELRREAFQFARKKVIPAKIVEANDLEVRIISTVENYHRKNLNVIEKEQSIYQLWKDGMDKPFNNNKHIMSQWTGIPYDRLKDILQAGEEKDKEKEKKEEEQSKAILNASAQDLKITRQLEKIDPDARKELLEAKIKNNITQRGLSPTIKAIKMASEKNAPKEVLSGIAKLVSEKKLDPIHTEDFVNTIIQIPKEEQKQIIESIEKEEKMIISDIKPMAKAIEIASEKNAPKEVLTEIIKLVSEKRLDPNDAEDFARTIIKIPNDEQSQLVEHIEKEEKVDIYKIKNFIDTYITSPPDIQKKLMENEIDIKEAKAVSKFLKKESREQVLEERKIISNLKEKELEKHTNIRIKQEEEVEQYGDRKFGNLTKIDIEKIIKDFENSDEQLDHDTINNYREATSKIKKLFQASTVQNIHTDINKKIIIGLIKQVYEHCYEILLEIGEIKIIDDMSTKSGHIPLKKLYGNNKID